MPKYGSWPFNNGCIGGVAYKYSVCCKSLDASVWKSALFLLSPTVQDLFTNKSFHKDNKMNKQFHPQGQNYMLSFKIYCRYLFVFVGLMAILIRCFFPPFFGLCFDQYRVNFCIKLGMYTLNLFLYLFKSFGWQECLILVLSGLQLCGTQFFNKHCLVVVG